MAQNEISDMRQKITRRIIQVLVFTFIQGLILFLAAGTLAWDWGWVFIGSYLGAILLNAVVLFLINPAVIAERADTKGAKSWDQVWGTLAFGMMMIGLPLVGGLDFRFGWSRGVNQAVHLAGVGLFLAGGLFFAWAMAFNAKFSTVVRVGDAESHPVAMGGPYRIIRHPGYLGACLQSLGLPLLYGSWWGYIAASLAIVFLIVRTALEDRTLQAELPGYDRLVQQTPYRLLPGIW